MNKNVGRILRVIGMLLVAVLIVEVLVLSPRIFGTIRGTETTVGEGEPSVAALPTAISTRVLTPLAPTPTRVPTKIPTPTLFEVATEVPPPSATPEPTAEPESTDEAELTEELTSTPLPVPATSVPNGPEPTAIPGALSLDGMIHQTQDSYFTHAGPASLATLLTYWGAPASQYDVAAVLHGSAERFDDRYVSPQELAQYASDTDGMNAILRYGGTIDLLQQLIAAGFPVLIQNSFPVSGDAGWSGHYTIVNGYNEARQTFLTYDPYVGPYQLYTEAHIQDNWRDFNYVFIVVYSDDRADAALSTLGDYVDENWALQKAMATSAIELDELEGRDQFFAALNVGTTLMGYGDFRKASTAFDRALTLYDALPQNQQPSRLLWYVPQVYEAYSMVGRHQQVLDLADRTLANFESAVLEDSYYWRGKAHEGLNNSAEAATDLEIASQLNPTRFPPQE